MGEASSISNPSAAARESLISRLPPELSGLGRLAYNYWWSWHPGGEALFRAIDPERWESSGRNPVQLLIETSRLKEAAANRALIARVADLDRALAAELARPFADAPPASAERPIAFICAEYAVHASLPIYAGGLGVLAGDFLKEASDRCLPLVGVGLMYRRGYFHQRLDPSGWQHEWWSTEQPEDIPATSVSGPDGAPLTVSIPLRGEQVAARVWRVDVGRIPLFLLDTDLAQNSELGRWIGAQLYVGNRDVRLMQYALLGVGGVRALAAMGVHPAVVHLNEGHAALASIALAAEEIARGSPLPQALEAARRRVVFTTHTPVAAGNESYARAEVETILGKLTSELGIDLPELLALGRGTGESAERFGMTELALRTSRSANAVSKRHGEVARAMWQPLWPDRGAEAVPITQVTNGVHLATWMALPLRALLERYLGEGWERAASDPSRWKAIDAIPDEELWAVRNELRASLVQFVRARSISDRLARGEPLDYVEQAARTFDPHVLTIGFARRVAAYKRLHILIQDPPRALALLRGSTPIQVIIAGKAHPRDDEAKRGVQVVFGLKDQPGAAARVAFLEDYDLSMAQALVCGCDLWINLPRPPLEASGTSGMKAALNGGLNLSVLDGWWSEAFHGENGWAIRSEPTSDSRAQDARDADAFYRLLEQEVLPQFYERDAGGMPRRWIQRIKSSLRTIGPAFCTARMLSDYLLRIYGSRNGSAAGQ